MVSKFVEKPIGLGINEDKIGKIAATQTGLLRDVKTPEQQVYEKELIRVLNDKLTPEERQVLGLRFWEDKSHREIGKMLRVSYETVRKREIRILKKLEEILQSIPARNALRVAQVAAGKVAEGKNELNETTENQSQPKPLDIDETLLKIEKVLGASPYRTPEIETTDEDAWNQFNFAIGSQALLTIIKRIWSNDHAQIINERFEQGKHEFYDQLHRYRISHHEANQKLNRFHYDLRNALNPLLRPGNHRLFKEFAASLVANIKLSAEVIGEIDKILNPDEFKILIAFVGGETAEEIGEKRQLPILTVRWRMLSALEKIAEKVEAQE